MTQPGKTPPAPERGPLSAEGWREPTRSIPLRSGGYSSRYVAALVLLFAGALLVQATSVYTGYLLVIGIGAHVLGWMLLPSIGVRRVVIALPSALCASALLISPLASLLLVVPLVGWLWTRQRPIVAYLVTIFPVLSGLILGALFPHYGHGLVVVIVSIFVIVACAWLARTIARTRRIPSLIRPAIR